MWSFDIKGNKLNPILMPQTGLCKVLPRGSTRNLQNLLVIGKSLTPGCSKVPNKVVAFKLARLGPTIKNIFDDAREYTYTHVKIYK